jgi:uncharacterized protein (TIGR02217 family)
MADIGVLPKLAGQSWSVKKTPTFQTRIQRAVSGRELRALDYPFPLWQFELTWEALGDNLGGAASSPPIGSLLATDLRTLMGFFLACQGAFATFLYDDPTDDQVTGQWLGVSGAGTTQAQLFRTFGAGVVSGAPPPAISLFEPITAPNIVSAVYFNGIRQLPSAYSLDPATGLLTFYSAIPATTTVTADFSYYFRCRFVADAYTFENFMFRLWSLKKLDFISVRP